MRFIHCLCSDRLFNVREHFIPQIVTTPNAQSLAIASFSNCATLSVFTNSTFNNTLQKVISTVRKDSSKIPGFQTPDGQDIFDATIGGEDFICVNRVLTFKVRNEF